MGPDVLLTQDAPAVVDPELPVVPRARDQVAVELAGGAACTAGAAVAACASGSAVAESREAGPRAEVCGNASKVYQQLTEQNTNVLALDCVPRMLSRGQTYDILSSQANIAGYRAVAATTAALDG